MCALSSKNQLINVKLDFNEVFFCVLSPSLYFNGEDFSPPPQKKEARVLLYIYIYV